MADDQPKIEITEIPLVAKIQLATEKQLKDDGMSVAEVELAKKHELVAKEPEVKPEDEKKPEEPKKEEPKSEEKIKEEIKEEPKVEEKKPQDLRVEEAKKYTKEERWYFNQMKEERKKRQEAQAERDQHFLKLKVLEKENEQLKQKVTPKTEEDLFGEEKMPVEDKKPIDIAEDEQAVKARRLNQGLSDAQLDGQMKYTDFDEVNKLANEVLTKPELAKGNKERLAYIEKLHSEMIATAYAMSEGKQIEENRTIADIAYELGTLHPNYGKKDSDKSSGTDTKEADSKLERVLDNAKVRTASAALGGAGGRSFITEDDLTPEQASKLSTERWMKLKPETKERILRAVS